MNYYSFLALAVLISYITGRWEIGIPLSGTPVWIGYKGDPDSRVLLYNMHDNENTSAVAGRIIASRYGGQYFELIHSGARNIGFAYGEDSIWIDPNRIYTETGIWKQLEKNNSNDTALFELVLQWRDSLLSILRIQERSLVIALHNNTNKFYSVESYGEEGEFHMDADSIYVGATRDMDDFYFVTEQAIFDRLASGRYHVVLQAKESVTDDGSLSVYCARYGIPYVNVEAQHRHLVRQIRMLLFAYEALVGASGQRVGSE